MTPEEYRRAGLRRWMLATSDARKLYQDVGFRTAGNPAAVMEIVWPGIYRSTPDEPCHSLG